MKRSFQIVLLLTLLATVVIYSISPFTAFESHFKTGHEAGDLITKGWLPQWFPKEAQDIHEKHDLDSNQMIVAFKLAKQYHQQLLSEAIVTTSTIRLPQVNLGTPAWWPRRILQYNIDKGRWKVYSKLYSDEAPTVSIPTSTLFFTFGPNQQIYAWHDPYAPQ